MSVICGTLCPLFMGEIGLRVRYLWGAMSVINGAPFISFDIFVCIMYFLLLVALSPIIPPSLAPLFPPWRFFSIITAAFGFLNACGQWANRASASTWMPSPHLGRFPDYGAFFKATSILYPIISLVALRFIFFLFLLIFFYVSFAFLPFYPHHCFQVYIIFEGEFSFCLKFFVYVYAVLGDS